MTCLHPQLSAEKRLVLQAARLDDGADALRVLLTERLDWHQVLDAALAHGVLPVLYTRLRDGYADLVPAAELQRLRAQFIYNGQRNLRLATRLLKVLAALKDSAVAPIPLKGPVLAVQAYGDLALRDFADLDLLIPRHALGTTVTALAELGYQATPALGTPAARDKLKADSELHFTDGEVHIDVHWRPIERFYPLAIDLEGWRDRLVTVDLLERPVPALSPEDGLLYLTVNGLRDGWVSLKTIVDVAHLYSAPGLDHQQLWAQAEAIGARRILALGLTLAHDVAGLALSTQTLERTHSDRGVRELADEAEARLMLELVDGAEAWALFRRCRERLRDRILCRLTPGPRDWAVVQLPESLDALYYVVRPLRLGYLVLRQPVVAAGRFARRLVQR